MIIWNDKSILPQSTRVYLTLFDRSGLKVYRFRIPRFLGSPTRLIITIIVIRQSAQVSSIHANDVNFASVVIAILIKIGSENHPLAIRLKGRPLTIPTGCCQLTSV